MPIDAIILVIPLLTWHTGRYYENPFAASSIILAFALAIATPCRARTSRSSASAENYFINWFPRVTQIQSEQPHWITPLVTVTPRLEEEVRYDQLLQSIRHGVATDNFGGGKGLELIPFQNTEIIIGVPAWIAHNGHILHGPTFPTDDWADWTFLVKYRLLSANEENGNYIVTAFMGFSVPTGIEWKQFKGICFSRQRSRPAKASATSTCNRRLGSRFRTAAWIGWDGRSSGIPPSSIGSSNISGRNLKPTTPGFRRACDTGQSQLFLTPGLLIGRIPIHERVGVTFGAGYQVAVTDHPTYHNAVILSARIPF